jgi:uncharacterized protein YndB with AHSA1/START domain
VNRSLVVEQHVAADAAAVYAAWTSADGLATWWWPHLADTVYEVDARVGGAYRIWSEAAGIGVRGEFLRLDEPREIGMTWEWLNDQGTPVPEQVWVRLSAVDGGTLVKVTHELHESVDSDVDQRQGWESVLGRLAETRSESVA